jgi:L-lysine 2,3-aminomutase
VAVNSLEELYNSQQYKTKAEEVVSDALKRKTPDQFNPDNADELEKFDEIKKKIKSNIKEFILNKMSSPQPNAQELPISSLPVDPILVQEGPFTA